MKDLTSYKISNYGKNNYITTLYSNIFYYISKSSTNSKYSQFNKDFCTGSHVDRLISKSFFRKTEYVGCQRCKVFFSRSRFYKPWFWINKPLTTCPKCGEIIYDYIEHSDVYESTVSFKDYNKVAVNADSNALLDRIKACY